MAKEVLNKDVLSEIFKVMPSLLKLPKKKIWIDYDGEADV